MEKRILPANVESRVITNENVKEWRAMAEMHDRILRKEEGKLTEKEKRLLATYKQMKALIKEM